MHDLSAFSDSSWGLRKMPPVPRRYGYVFLAGGQEIDYTAWASAEWPCSYLCHGGHEPCAWDICLLASSTKLS